MLQHKFELSPGDDQQCVCIGASVFSDFSGISQIFLRLRRSVSFEASDLFAFGCTRDVQTTTRDVETTTTEVQTTTTVAPATTTLGFCGKLVMGNGIGNGTLNIDTLGGFPCVHFCRVGLFSR